jgi:hypothetical protein
MYPRLANSNGDSNSEIDPNDFYITGTTKAANPYNPPATANIVDQLHLRINPCFATSPSNLMVSGQTLTWTFGSGNQPQYIRVGTNRDAVASGCQNGVGGNTGCIFRSGALAANLQSYTLTEPMISGTTYFFRVLNSNGADCVRDAIIESKMCLATSPANLAMNGQTLTWTPGSGNQPQYIRLGTNRDAVVAGCQNGVGGNTGCIFRSGALASDLQSFTFTDALVPGTTYYIKLGNSDGGSCVKYAILDYAVPNLGDLNHDGKVDIDDLQIIVNNFGNVNSDSRLNADLNKDNKIDLKDVVILAKKISK